MSEENKKRKAEEDDTAPESGDIPPSKKISLGVDGVKTEEELDATVKTENGDGKTAPPEAPATTTDQPAATVKEEQPQDRASIEAKAATNVKEEVVAKSEPGKEKTLTSPAPAPAPTPQISQSPVAPGVPMGVPVAVPPTGVPTGIPTPIGHAQTNTNPAPHRTNAAPVSANGGPTITETSELLPQFVGKIIGKGGEQIRDLQARSACKVDVDQNVPPMAPKIITYQGTRDKIEFAKKLVNMLCFEGGGRDIELPLGYACKAQIQVPSSVVGKIIGRGGEMIKELQSKSFAKIQVDHSGAAENPYRTVTVIGNELSVKRAEEMINLLIANPLADASTSVDMLIREKNQGTSEWGSGPPYTSMPNNGQGMTSDMLGGGMGRGNYGNYQQSYGGGGGYGSYGQQQPQQQQQQQQSMQHYGNSGGIESDVFYAAKMYMGRIIGSKGVTINDLQKRSGCDIQINQNVPMGQDCEVNIKGTRQQIESAKQMIQEIIQQGPSHSFAGGQSSRHGGGGGYMNQQNSYGGGQQQYGQQQQQQQQYPAYGQQPAATYGQPQQQYGQHMYGNQANNYSNAPQQPPQYGYQQQPQQYQQQPQAQYNQYQQQPAQAAIGGMPQTMEWKAAKAPDGQTYYYNEKTGATTWDKPVGMP